MRKRLKRIHINQHRIKANRKDGQNRPVITVKVGKENHYAHNVEFGGGIVRYSPDKPLPCGAVVWIETRESVSLADAAGNVFGFVE